jgi:hypothetical protein
MLRWLFNNSWPALHENHMGGLLGLLGVSGMDRVWGLSGAVDTAKRCGSSDNAV